MAVIVGNSSFRSLIKSAYAEEDEATAAYLAAESFVQQEQQMNLTHIHALTDAMKDKNLEAMLTHMTDDVILKTPLVAESFHGKAAIRPVVAALLSLVDKFEFLETMQGPQHVSEFFRVTVGAHELDGVDYWLLNEAGLIQEMTVLWRPLPAVAAVQNKLDQAATDARVAKSGISQSAVV